VPEPRTAPKGDPLTRQSLLDAAAAIMVEDGYAAATTRSVASRAGVNNALVYYYFGTMDELFLELFRHGAERSFERLEVALTSEQPLWGLWDLIHDFSGSALTMELIALANHRKAIRAEISAYSKRFRTRQLELLTGVLEGYGVNLDEWPVTSVVLLMAGISRYLLIEEAFDVQIGHRETVALIERHITALEGRRRVPRAAAKARA